VASGDPVMLGAESTLQPGEIEVSEIGEAPGDDEADAAARGVIGVPVGSEVSAKALTLPSLTCGRARTALIDLQ